MATSQGTQNVTLIANAALAIYTFAKAHTVAREVVQATDTTGVDFIVARTALAGEDVSLIIGNGAVPKITLGATLSAGDAVMPGTSGFAVAEAGDNAIGAGTLLEGGVSGDIVEMIFAPRRRAAA